MRKTEQRFQKMLQRVAMISLAACHSDPIANDAATDGDDPIDADDGACSSEPFDATDDAQIDCSTFVTLPCGLSEAAVAQVSECYVDLETCYESCKTNELFYCVLTPSACTLDAGIFPDAATTLECVSCLGGGRRPRGLVARSSCDDSFAALAHMEAASVRAFRDLERSLISFRAPRRLVDAARRARADETRHARAMKNLARKFGERCERVRVKRVKAPSLVELLVDDAIEGCVHETVGAVLLAVRAARSNDARVRRTLERISRDEANHAALSWEVLRWGLPRISHGDRARVRTSLDAAWATFEKAAPTRPETKAIARELRVATTHEVAW